MPTRQTGERASIPRCGMLRWRPAVTLGTESRQGAIRHLTDQARRAECRHHQVARIAAALEPPTPPPQHHRVGFRERRPQAPPGVIILTIPAATSASALARAASELRYFYALDPSDFEDPVWMGVEA